MSRADHPNDPFTLERQPVACAASFKRQNLEGVFKVLALTLQPLKDLEARPITWQAGRDDVTKKNDNAGKPGNAQGKDAFERWLQRGLSHLFSDAVAEPLPEHLLRLIEETTADEEKELSDYGTDPARLED